MIRIVSPRVGREQPVSPQREPRPSPTGISLSGRRRPDDAPTSATSSYGWGLRCINFPQLIAARDRSSRSRIAACSSNAARSAAPRNACVGKTSEPGETGPGDSVQDLGRARSQAAQGALLPGTMIPSSSPRWPKSSSTKGPRPPRPLPYPVDILNSV